MCLLCLRGVPSDRWASIASSGPLTIATCVIALDQLYMTTSRQSEKIRLDALIGDGIIPDRRHDEPLFVLSLLA